MLKYLVVAMFVAVFFLLIRRDRAYFVPMILIIYSNINGLLDWEDFALKGVVKFQDYGLILTILVLFFGLLRHKNSSIQALAIPKGEFLYRLIVGYWLYYFILFLYSILIQGDVEWPIKMSRTFFYGLAIYLVIDVLRISPVEFFGKIVNSLKYFTLFFGILYISYNIGGLDVYPKGEHETFLVADIGEVKRNFSGFPTFTFYFLIFFIHQLLTASNGRVLSFLGALLMAACIVLTLTRGAILAMVVISLITIFYRIPNAMSLRRSAIFGLAALLLVPLLLQYGQGHLEVLTLRFGEFFDAGSATESGNFLVRATEFSTIVSNVFDFNPLFGFGFTNVAELGYQSSLIHGGSADNGFSNIIGVTGFLGLLIFCVMMTSWIVVNIRLQSLRCESYSKVNFIFILYIFISFFNGSSMSYMHTYGLFMAYDLVAFAYFSNRQRTIAGVLNSGNKFQLKI
nr:O-antigen ligase family protein [uncultured Rhodoferax sp.]